MKFKQKTDWLFHCDQLSVKCSQFIRTQKTTQSRRKTKQHCSGFRFLLILLEVTKMDVPPTDREPVESKFYFLWISFGIG